MKVFQIDKDLPQPKYATSGSVGLDTYVRESILIQSKSYGLIPLNLIIQVPEGTFIGVLPRSSTFKRTGLILANSIGVIDRDYCGPEDEIMALVYNTSDKIVGIDKGERLFQLIIFNCETPEIEIVEEYIKDNSRGGYGSTGK